jgi:hypothetical protein
VEEPFLSAFDVHGVNGVRQTEIHKVEPLMPKPSAYEIEVSNEKLNIHRSPGIDQIRADLIELGGRTIRSEVHELTYSIWNMGVCLISRRSRSLYLSKRMVIK